MAVDKLVDSTQLNSDLTSVANAIRAKSGGSSQLAFPAGFVSEIGNIPTGGSQPTPNVADYFAFVPVFDDTWETTTFSLISYPSDGILSIPHSFGSVPDYVVIFKTDLTSEDIGGCVGGYNFISGAKTDNALNRNLVFNPPSGAGTGNADLPNYGFYGIINPNNWNMVGGSCADWTSTTLSIRVGTSKSTTNGWCLGEYIVGMKKVS